MQSLLNAELEVAIESTREIRGGVHDALLQAFIVELERYRALVNDHWPLTAEERETVDIGRVAVHELDEVFPDYVTLLCELGAKLKRLS